MEDVGAIRYLTKDKNGWKLRRAVPKELQQVAGKTAWVERVDGRRKSDIKERANLFATRTDAEVKSLRLKAAHNEVNSPTPEEGALLRLSRTDAEHVAIRFFNEQDQRNAENGSYFADPGDARFDDILEDAYAGYDEARREASGVENRAPGRALRALVEYGYLPDTVMQSPRRMRVPEELHGNREFQYLCLLIERAELELARRRLEALRNGALPPIGDDLFSKTQAIGGVRATPAAASGKTVSDLIAAFLARKKVEVTRSRFSQFQIPGRAMQEQWGSRYLLSEVERQHCKDLGDLFVRIPAYVRQHYKDMKLIEAAEAYEAKHGKPADRHDEAQKNLAVLRQMFEFAIREGWMTDNPAVTVDITKPANQKKKHEEKEESYLPFDTEDLKSIFSAPLYTGCLNDERGYNRPGDNIIRRHRFWAPLIALWTGMRMNEILQLERGDIRREGGIWFIAATDEEEGQYKDGKFRKRLKNKNAVRDIPVHPELERLGFVEWAQKRSVGRLFPEAVSGVGEKPSDAFSKRFSTFLKSRGVWVARRKVFHSFRNSFNDALRDGGVSEEMRTAINGWTNQRSMDGRYGRGHKVATLYEAIKKASYPGLDLSHLYDLKD